MSIDSGLAKELDLTSDALTETAHLQKHFGRYDILFFTICTLVGIDTIGTVAASCLSPVGGARFRSGLVWR